MVKFWQDEEVDTPQRLPAGNINSLLPNQWSSSFPANQVSAVPAVSRTGKRAPMQRQNETILVDIGSRPGTPQRGYIFWGYQSEEKCRSRSGLQVFPAGFLEQYGPGG